MCVCVCVCAQTRLSDCVHACVCVRACVSVCLFVHTTVGAQGGGVKETLVTLRTLVGPHSFMHQLVSLQAARVGKGRWAL